MRRLAFALAGLVCAVAVPPAAAQDRPPHVVLVTIDGLRWEELFRGADPDLVRDARYRARYVDAPNRAEALAPFLLSLAQYGALIGNRDAGSCARVSNDYWFSYPGYVEMLEGRPNPNVRSNDAGPNPNATVLERLAQRPDFANEVRVYAEWNVVPAILNAERSRIPVFTPADESAPHDPQVVAAAQEIFARLPRVAWIALGDTDNRAHEGRYESYLAAATEADNFLRALWEAIEADPRTAGNTTLIVATDHGRGPSRGGGWKGHGSGLWNGVWVPFVRQEGSDAIFLAARGPGVADANAYTMENCATASQVAATLLRSLGLLSTEGQPDMAPPLAIFSSAGR